LARRYFRGSQIESALHPGAAEAPITTIVTDNYAHVHPDHPLERVLDRLAKNPGLLPVVSRSVNRVEGVITPQTLVQFVQENWKDQRTVAANTEDPSGPTDS
jgi:predicted transcriptional regulator